MLKIILRYILSIMLIFGCYKNSNASIFSGKSKEYKENSESKIKNIGAIGSVIINICTGIQYIHSLYDTNFRYIENELKREGIILSDDKINGQLYTAYIKGSSYYKGDERIKLTERPILNKIMKTILLLWACNVFSYTLGLEFEEDRRQRKNSLLEASKTQGDDMGKIPPHLLQRAVQTMTNANHLICEIKNKIDKLPRKEIIEFFYLHKERTDENMNIKEYLLISVKMINDNSLDEKIDNFTKELIRE